MKKIRDFLGFLFKKDVFADHCIFFAVDDDQQAVRSNSL